MIIPSIIIILTLVYIKVHPKSVKEKLFSSFFLILFVTTYYGGGIAIRLFEKYLGGFKSYASVDLSLVYTIAFFSLIMFIIGNNIRLPKIFSNKNKFTHLKQMKVISFIITVLSISLYVYFNGLVLFKQGGYENRYVSNIGLGMITLFFPFGLIYLLSKYFLLTEKRKWLVFLYSFIYAVVVFVVKGGQRQIGFAALFNFFVLLYLYKEVKVLRLLFLGFVGLLFVNIIAVFRYVDDVSNIDVLSLVTPVIYHIYDGLMPVDALLNIINYYHEGGHMPGFEVVLNQFLVLVPRAIWPGKPEIMMNAGNFYTMHILNRDMFITYSPTFLGELFLIGGYLACFVGSFITGVMLNYIDKLINNRKGLLMIYFLSFIFLLNFNLYREGLFVMISQIFSFWIFYIPIVLLLKSLPYKKENG